jgi:N-acetyl-gamma-glutamyl-phosphate reductase common form
MRRQGTGNRGQGTADVVGAGLVPARRQSRKARGALAAPASGGHKGRPYEEKERLLLAPDSRLPTAVLGGNGYIAGELLRLIAGHPALRLLAVGSREHAGEHVGTVFPHLAGSAVAAAPLASYEVLPSHFRQGETVGVLAATPHGATAALVDELLGAAAARGCTLKVVDLSADFRFADPARYQAVYGHAHGAPARCAEFACAVPEHAVDPAAHVAHPGCFTTSVVLAAYPVLAAGLCVPEVFVSAVTGSSGGGRQPGVATHHPERRSNLYAYSPLAHRHEAEMRVLLGEACQGREPEVEFVPHSGPFVRGIHATLRLTLHEPLPAADVAARIAAFYGEGSFITASTAPARLADVIGSNRCVIGVAVRGRTLVLTSAIDNLVKGAAGGALQWLNRMLGLPHDLGLRTPGLGWV